MTRENASRSILNASTTSSKTDIVINAVKIRTPTKDSATILNSQGKEIDFFLLKLIYSYFNLRT